MRVLHSFLISLNAHIWGILLLSLVFTFSRPDPEPERIEVQLLRLPAPVDGKSGAISEMVLPRTTTHRRSRSEVFLPSVVHLQDRTDSRQKTAELNDEPRVRLQPKRGPRVEYRVRVAKTSSPVAVRNSGTWTPAWHIRFPESEYQAPGSRIFGVSPEAPSPTGGGAHGRKPSGENPTKGGAQIQDGTHGGDVRPLIRVIQARIDAVTPLAHASAGPCQTQKGVVLLKFIVNQAGYPCGFKIIASSGVRCLDDEVDNVLHMAEPYPYVAGWIPVTVRFAPRTRI